jgi:LytS/YehU family sensor histidine kinase
MPSEVKRRPSGAPFLIAIYAAFVLVAGTATRSMAHDNPTLGFLHTVINDGTFIVLNYLIARYLFGRRRTVDVKTVVGVMLLSVAIGIAYYFVIQYVLAVVFAAVVPPPIHPFAPGSVILYYGLLSLSFCLTWVWMIGIETSTERELAAQQAQNDAESRVLQSELRRLRNQIDPHFLFNCLNTAITEVHERPKRATALLRELSAYLRYSLDIADRSLSPLAAEFAALRSFLRVQDVRFGSRLASRVVLDRAARERLVPTLLLQPLIENATKYGIPGDDGVLNVTVEAVAEGEVVTITVTNTGLLQPHPSELPSTRVGLANLRSRLILHYADRASFNLDQVGDDVVARLVLNGSPV